MSIKSSTISSPSDLGQRLAEEFKGRYFAHQPLGQHSTTGTGGVADHLVIAETAGDIWTGYRLAAESGWPVRVVGGGSGVIFSDVGCPGLVIINRASGLWFDRANNQVLAESGVLNRTLVIGAYERELGGLEFLYGVPGTLGGAVATGASHARQSIVTSILEVTLAGRFDSKLAVVNLSAERLELSPWRWGVANYSGESPPAILLVKLRLSRLPQLQIGSRMDEARARFARQQRLSRAIGDCFWPPPTVDALKLSSKLRLANIRPVDSHLAEVVGRQVCSGDLRVQIEAWRSSLERQTGQSLERRLDYLGYWPDDDQTVASSQSENPSR